MQHPITVATSRGMATTNRHAGAAVGPRIRELRGELELAQRDLALPGTTYAYLSRIENGTRTPSLSALIQIAASFREAAQMKLDNYDDEGIIAADGSAFAEWVARLRWVAENCSALYLLTGEADGDCVLCGRNHHHDDNQRRGSNGHDGNGSTRSRRT